MYPTKDCNSIAEFPWLEAKPWRRSKTRNGVKARDYCSYNLTRECFLALEVADVDARRVDLREFSASFSLKSGEGLWIVPFKGLPAWDGNIPLDLIYLDESQVVMEVEESYVPCRGAPMLEDAASVLILPRYAIYVSHTQSGDQMMICRTGEMARRLELLSIAGSPGEAEEAISKEMPVRSEGATVLKSKTHSKGNPLDSLQPNEIELVEPRKERFKLPKNWFERWWSPDPRKAPRKVAHNLVAFYWTGATAIPHVVKDINSRGLYLVTEDRWYPGTMVLITLQRTDCTEQDPLHSIRVYATAVRYGSDGIGLQFAFSDLKDGTGSQDPRVDSAARKDLQIFLHGISRP